MKINYDGFEIVSLISSSFLRVVNSRKWVIDVVVPKIEGQSIRNVINVYLEIQSKTPFFKKSPSFKTPFFLRISNFLDSHGHIIQSEFLIGGPMESVLRVVLVKKGISSSG